MDEGLKLERMRTLLRRCADETEEMEQTLTQFEKKLTSLNQVRKRNGARTSNGDAAAICSLVRGGSNRSVTRLPASASLSCAL